MSTTLIEQDNIEVTRHSGGKGNPCYYTILNQATGEVLRLSREDLRALMCECHDIIVRDDIDLFLDEKL